MSDHDVLERLLDRYGTTYADEVGITVKDKPAPLFQLLVTAHVLSANISSELGVRAAKALRKAYRTPRAMAAASDHDRWEVLTDARFLRKDRNAELLGRTAQQVLDDWDGDLRNLRDAADGDGAKVAELVTGFDGIGPVGGDIFAREVQAVWTGVRPYADQKVLDIAKRLDLPHSAKGLVDLVGTEDLSRVGGALVRVDLADALDEVKRR